MKLEEYFAEQGKYEPLRVCIPKGAYVPIFTTSTPEIVEPFTDRGSTVPASSRQYPVESGAAAGGSKFPRLSWRLTSVLLALTSLILGAGLFLRPKVLPDSAKPHLSSDSLADAFWREIFSPVRTTVIVPGDNGLVLYENTTGKTVSLEEYLSGFRKKSPPYLFDQSESSIAANLAWRRVTTIVDLDVTNALNRVPEASETNVQIIYARDLRPNNLMGRNLILIGADEANPWVELYGPSMDFILRNDVKIHTFRVLNKQPEANEPKEYL